MITSDSEYSKLVVWEGEEGFLWSEKPVEGDQTKNKNLQESYAELEIANKRLASALDIEQKKLVPFQQQVTSLKGDLARAEGERDQFKKEVADLQEKLKQVNAGSGDSKKLKDDLKAVSKERDDLKAVNEKLSADLVKATKTAEKEAPKETTGK
jgi:chromosome segregation ATPase